MLRILPHTLTVKGPIKGAVGNRRASGGGERSISFAGTAVRPAVPEECGTAAGMGALVTSEVLKLGL